MKLLTFKKLSFKFPFKKIPVYNGKRFFMIYIKPRKFKDSLLFKLRPGPMETPGEGHSWVLGPLFDLAALHVHEDVSQKIANLHN